MSWRGGWVRIQTFNDGTYQPAEDGTKAFMVAVDAEVTDLVAWVPASPGRWWMRRGVAPVLNPLAIDRACHFGTPLRLYGTPESWLSAGQGGIVILDWRAAPDFWLADVERVICDTAALAQRLERTFRPRVPKFRVEGVMANAA